jgi:hypothetical protein
MIILLLVFNELKKTDSTRIVAVVVGDPEGAIRCECYAPGILKVAIGVRGGDDPVRHHRRIGQAGGRHRTVAATTAPAGRGDANAAKDAHNATPDHTMQFHGQSPLVFISATLIPHDRETVQLHRVKGRFKQRSRPEFSDRTLICDC